MTTRINESRDTPGAEVWQRNYYESIMRDDDHLWATRQYINGNPAHWTEDGLHPDRWDGRYPGDSTADGGGHRDEI